MQDDMKEFGWCSKCKMRTYIPEWLNYTMTPSNEQVLHYCPWCNGIVNNFLDSNTGYPLIEIIEGKNLMGFANYLVLMVMNRMKSLFLPQNLRFTSKISFTKCIKDVWIAMNWLGGIKEEMHESTFCNPITVIDQSC